MTVTSSFSENDSVYTIEVEGDFCFATLHDFRDAYYHNNVAESAKNIVVDLRMTKTVDSTALGMLLNLQKHLNKADSEIKIINSNDVIANIFKITNFGAKFNIE